MFGPFLRCAASGACATRVVRVARRLPPRRFGRSARDSSSSLAAFSSTPCGINMQALREWLALMKIFHISSL